MFLEFVSLKRVNGLRRTEGDLSADTKRSFMAVREGMLRDGDCRAGCL